jgi:Tfp pilus assembly protein PilX
MADTFNDKRESERGIALVTALLAMMLLLALGVAVVSSTTTDTATTKVQRVGEQAFFIADAGIGIARRALAEAVREEIERIRAGEAPFYLSPTAAGVGQFPRVQVTPPPNGTWNQTFYQRVRTRAMELASVAARDDRFAELNGSSFEVTYSPLTGSVTVLPSGASDAVEVIVLRYSIQVTGRTDSGGSATVNETGRISTNINLVSSAGDPSRRFAFSGFGAFFDYGDTLANSALASGTFTGPVHTNTHFAFDSNRNVTFRNVVSQVDSRIRYDFWSSTSPNRNIPNADIKGIDISSEGYQRVAPVPLPDNNFSQEYAVINATGITDLGTDGSPIDPPSTMPRDGAGNTLPVFDAQGRVTAEALRVNLRNAANAVPNLSGGALPNGVYISSGNGSSVTGAGIYVQGNASDIQLYADTNGDQVYVITQGTTTTTVRTSFANNTTRISSGSSSTTYSGIFTDKSNPASHKPGVMLFVNGSINSLRGGKSGATNKPAIASNTRMTITAQRDITVTGTPVSNLDAVQNVFGIFTNDGNVNLAPNSSYVGGPGLSLEMNAAVVDFNKNTSNDGSRIEGSITYTGGTSPAGTDRWKLVGSRVQSKINNIGYSYRDIYFDVRFSGGTFAPPFFPGTTYSLAPPPAPDEVAISAVDTPAPTAMSWFRNTE